MVQMFVQQLSTLNAFGDSAGTQLTVALFRVRTCHHTDLVGTRSPSPESTNSRTGSDQPEYGQPSACTARVRVRPLRYELNVNWRIHTCELIMRRTTKNIENLRCKPIRAVSEL
eukprot:1109205_1